MKKGFSLFEVVLSFIILSIVIVNISKSFKNSDNIENYYELQKQENSFIEFRSVNSTHKIKFE